MKSCSPLPRPVVLGFPASRRRRRPFDGHWGRPHGFGGEGGWGWRRWAAEGTPKSPANDGGGGGTKSGGVSLKPSVAGSSSSSRGGGGRRGGGRRSSGGAGKRAAAPRPLGASRLPPPTSEDRRTGGGGVEAGWTWEGLGPWALRGSWPPRPGSGLVLHQSYNSAMLVTTGLCMTFTWTAESAGFRSICPAPTPRQGWPQSLS